VLIHFVRRYRFPEQSSLVICHRHNSPLEHLRSTSSPGPRRQYRHSQLFSGMVEPQPFPGSLCTWWNLNHNLNYIYILEYLDLPCSMRGPRRFTLFLVEPQPFSGSSSSPGHCRDNVAFPGPTLLIYQIFSSSPDHVGHHHPIERNSEDYFCVFQ